MQTGLPGRLRVRRHGITHGLLNAAPTHVAIYSNPPEVVSRKNRLNKNAEDDLRAPTGPINCDSNPQTRLDLKRSSGGVSDLRRYEHAQRDR